MNTMRSIFLFALLIAAAALVESVGYAPREDGDDTGGDDQPTNDPCDGARNGTTFCGDCSTVLDCTGPALAEYPCAPEYACHESGDEAFCVPEKDAVECSCTGDSMCDPFDPTIVMVCRPDGGVLVTAACGEDQQCYGGQCADTTSADPSAATTPLPSSCEEADAGTWKPVGEGCTSYAFCLSDLTTAISNDCEAGSYYDEIIGSCTPAPPYPCTGCEGTCPDPNDCSRYYECKGGEIISALQCLDDTDKFFDYKIKSCADISTVCDPRVACGYGSDYTTPIGGATATPSGGINTTPSDGGDGTTPSASECNEDNAYQMYPYPGNCKMYCQCRPTASGGYEIACSECTGSLVYNPDIDKCDLQSNVPDCVVPTSRSLV